MISLLFRLILALAIHATGVGLQDFERYIAYKMVALGIGADIVVLKPILKFVHFFGKHKILLLDETINHDNQ